ncbi:DUF305 domain-containing protein [Cryptosporangium sp. NPDC051539]|uniref:DUF305 domain-containing protein n=1 Tax=Cryptosporangium sp. NPDC051539 TaxID=3363962 RepID=UPI0037B354BF
MAQRPRFADARRRLDELDAAADDTDVSSAEPPNDEVDEEERAAAGRAPSRPRGRASRRTPAADLDADDLDADDRDGTAEGRAADEVDAAEDRGTGKRHGFAETRATDEADAADDRGQGEHDGLAEDSAADEAYAADNGGPDEHDGAGAHGGPGERLSPGDGGGPGDGPAQGDGLNGSSGPAPRRRAGRKTRIFRAAMAAILVLAVGFGIGVWVGSPHRPADDSADAGFTRDMMTHHAQAVAMASLEYRVTDDAPLRQLSVDITLTQQAQIGIMIAWLRNWDLNPTSTQSPMAWMPDGGRALIVDGRMPGMASDAQLEQLRTSTGTARDLLFIKLMIAHHLGGIHMADAALKQAKDDQVLYLAHQIKDSQQSEIEALQQEQKRLTAQK